MMLRLCLMQSKWDKEGDWIMEQIILNKQVTKQLNALLALENRGPGEKWTAEEFIERLIKDYEEKLIKYYKE